MLCFHPCFVCVLFMASHFYIQWIVEENFYLLRIHMHIKWPPYYKGCTLFNGQRESQLTICCQYINLHTVITLLACLITPRRVLGRGFTVYPNESAAASTWVVKEILWHLFATVDEQMLALAVDGSFHTECNKAVTTYKVHSRTYIAVMVCCA